MLIGAAYYPEHWPKDRWSEDARLMEEAGLGVVRLAEFAWHRLEPKEGQYDFAWLDEVMEVLASRGIRVVMCTPSAAPTARHIARWPDLLPVLADGRRYPFGIRRHYCFRHAGYRDACRRMADAMARHFGRNKQVLGWQIDNEFGGIDFGAMCYCPRCVQQWREWLRGRYGTLDALNEAWGTAFWSQEYSEWDQIVAPAEPVKHQNPSLYLDWRRFTSEGVLEFQQIQTDALRPHVGRQWIATNLMGLFVELDYHALAAPLDLVGWDCYPLLMKTYSDVTIAHAAARGLKQKNFWVFEQQSGPHGWNTMSRAARPGEIRLWTYQSVACGADAVEYFRWRVATSGTEQYWHGILDHDARPGRRYEEVKRTAGELARLADAIAGTEVRAAAALWHLYDAHWVIGFQPGCPGMDLWQEAARFERALGRRGVMYDVVGPPADLARYRILICPHAVILSPEHARALGAFAEAGGTLVLTARSGERTWSNRIVQTPRPGLLADLAGCRVAEYDMVAGERCVRLRMTDTGRQYDAFGWCDILEVEGADVVATYAADFYAGRPAATVHAVGKGRVYYIGASAEDAFYADLIGRLCEEQGVPMLGPLATGVEALERRGRGRRLLFLLNHNAAPASADVGVQGKDLLSGARLGPRVNLEPHGVRVLEAPTA